jgi:hypothetical protein
MLVTNLEQSTGVKLADVALGSRFNTGFQNQTTHKAACARLYRISSSTSSPNCLPKNNMHVTKKKSAYELSAPNGSKNFSRTGWRLCYEDSPASAVTGPGISRTDASATQSSSCSPTCQ